MSEPQTQSSMPPEPQPPEIPFRLAPTRRVWIYGIVMTASANGTIATADIRVVYSTLEVPEQACERAQPRPAWYTRLWRWIMRKEPPHA